MFGQMGCIMHKGRRMKAAEIQPAFRSPSNVLWHGLHAHEEEVAFSILTRAPEGLAGGRMKRARLPKSPRAAEGSEVLL